MYSGHTLIETCHPDIEILPQFISSQIMIRKVQVSTCHRGCGFPVRDQGRHLTGIIAATISLALICICGVSWPGITGIPVHRYQVPAIHRYPELTLF